MDRIQKYKLSILVELCYNNMWYAIRIIDLQVLRHFPILNTYIPCIISVIPGALAQASCIIHHEILDWRFIAWVSPCFIATILIVTSPSSQKLKTISVHLSLAVWHTLVIVIIFLVYICISMHCIGVLPCGLYLYNKYNLITS